MYKLSLSYIPLYVHIYPGYKEKSADLEGTLKLHMRFYNRISRLQRPRNEIWHAHYFLRVCSMANNASASQMKFMRGLGKCILLASVVSAPHDFKCLACTLIGAI